VKRVFLTGQESFGNRGCEAIVRGTVAMLRTLAEDVEVVVPSARPALDAAQWPEAADRGVRFVPAFKSVHNKYWRHVQRLPLRAAKRAGWPFPLGRGLKGELERADAVLSIGGDNYSLDYRLPSLLLATDAFAMDRGKPVVLWGASVGPFEAEPDFVPVVREHLRRMARVAVRESVSQAYLESTLGLGNVIRVADPAFHLEPQPVEATPFWPADPENGVVGLNVSPLIQRYRPRGEAPGALLDEVGAFVRWLVDEARVGVLLVPHVVPLTGGTKNNDAHYMAPLLERAAEQGRHVAMMPPDLNAAQTKDVIRRCRFFVGARTHATIAALSSGVPTISIAYSVKAKGINLDLLGHTEHVLETPRVSASTLAAHYRALVADEAAIRARLEDRLPAWRDLARRGATELAEVW
jgi:colanic acid/amylovoran biosynthesis protein